MTRDELKNGVADTFSNCMKTLIKKNNDYAGNADALRNFKLVSYLGLASTPQGILVRLCDKFSRIVNIYNGGALVAESVEDTIEDTINYLAILKEVLKESYEQKKD